MHLAMLSRASTLSWVHFTVGAFATNPRMARRVVSEAQPRHITFATRQTLSAFATLIGAPHWHKAAAGRAAIRYCGAQYLYPLSKNISRTIAAWHRILRAVPTGRSGSARRQRMRHSVVPLNDQPTL